MGSEELEKEKSGLCKKIVQLSFSHFGLCFIVILYCVIGGLLFELLEKENEIAACKDARKEYTDMENETLFSLLDVVLNNPLESNAADVQLLGVFESFRNNSFSIGYEGLWCEGYGKEDGPNHEWTFAGGLFFSMTVITTIGYGHIAPKTVWGRLLCISYAMMGIPLMLMFLTNIGDVLADVFRYVYAKVICLGCLKRTKKKGPQRPSSGQSNEAFIPDEEKARGPLGQRNSSVANSRGTSMVNEPDSGRPRSDSKHNTPSMHREPSVLSKFEVQNSMPPDGTAIAGNGVKRRINNVSAVNIKPMNSSALEERGKMLRQTSPNSQTEPLVLDDEEDDDDEEEWENLSKICVPLTVSMGIIGLYIIGGAVLFKYWEGWDMLQSSYFCFITLSTIGFGDVTPGRDFDDPTANARLVIGTIYTIFGMAILSMCFTLMQEEMIEQFRWLGRKMGVVENDDDDLETFTDVQAVNVKDSQ